MKGSNISHARLDHISRDKKADKIISILRGFVRLEGCDLLDIGTGSGHIAYRILKGKEWDIFPLSFYDLKRMAGKRFIIKNMTIKVIKYPKRYHIGMCRLAAIIVRILPLKVLSLFNLFVPSYILVLKKKPVKK